MTTYQPDEEETRRRIAAARAKRGSPEQLAEIAAHEAAEDRAARAKAASASGRKTPENSADMFGHSWPFWYQMRSTGMEIIAEFARSRSYPTYGELWDALVERLGPDVGDSWRQMPILLGYICEEFHEEVGALPTAIVISQGGVVHPEAGFFRMAASFGLLAEEDAPPIGEEWHGMSERQRDFWKSQVQAVFDHFVE